MDKYFSQNTFWKVLGGFSSSCVSSRINMLRVGPHEISGHGWGLGKIPPDVNSGHFLTDHNYNCKSKSYFAHWWSYSTVDTFTNWVSLWSLILFVTYSWTYPLQYFAGMIKPSLSLLQYNSSDGEIIMSKIFAQTTTHIGFTFSMSVTIWPITSAVYSDVKLE